METRYEVDVARAVPRAATGSARPKVVVCLTSHNRPDCARINMEIIKLNYAEPWLVVHATSDASYEPHMEDVLVRCEPRPFIQGALNLLLQSCWAAVDAYNPQYIVHLEADTWVLDQQVIQRYIDQLERNDKAYVAASTWSTDQRWQWRRSRHPFAKVKLGLAKILNAFGSDFGVKRKQTLATQFFIAKNDPRLIQALATLVPTLDNTLEYDFYQAFVKAFGRGAIIGMPEREPVHPDNKHSCAGLTLHCQHWPEQLPRPAGRPGGENPREGVTGQYDLPGKKEVLAAHGFRQVGPAMRKLLEAENTDYYNPGAKRY